MQKIKKIELRSINQDNWRNCADLQTSQEQLDLWRQFTLLQDTYGVVANVLSLADASVYPSAQTFAIYAGESMVGFVAYEPLRDTPDNSGYSIYRFMIDFRYQGMGYGRQALQEVVGLLSQKADCREIYTTVMPENHIARTLYRSAGFQDTGDIEDGEVVMRFPVAETAQP